MGSFQQISLGIICLVAAYAFGSYVNNNPRLNETPFTGLNAGVTSLDGAPTGNVHSLINDSFETVTKQPAQINTLKAPLKSRFDVPLGQQNQNTTQPAFESTLPPPSQLAVDAGEPVNTQSHFQGPLDSSVNQVPDFSAIAAEFKNTPIELPPFGSMPRHSNGQSTHNFSGIGEGTTNQNPQFNQAPAPQQNQTSLKDLANQFRNSNTRNGLARPNNNPAWDRSASPFADSNPNPSWAHDQRANINQPNETVSLEPPQAFSPADFEPKLNDDIFGLKPRQMAQPEVQQFGFENRDYDEFQNAPQRPQTDRDQWQSNELANKQRPRVWAKSGWGSEETNKSQLSPLQQHAADLNQNEYQNRLTAKPAVESRAVPLESGRARGNLTFRNTDPRLAEPAGQWSGHLEPSEQPVYRSDFEPMPERNDWDRRNQQQTAQYPPRRQLPFRLNNQARTDLANLSSRINSDIGLESTQFINHVIQRGETLQSISQRYFGQPDYYLDIYLANRNKLRNPGQAPQGVSIRIPIYDAQ